MKDTLKKLRQGQSLSQEEATNAFTLLLDGAVTPAQTGAFLMALSQRGETVDEIVSAASVLRARATSITTTDDAIDCCGTGGDHSGSYNISTAVALILAACGIPVAKHGNRAASSQSGAADVLENMGVHLNLSPEHCSEALRRYHFCFLMAPHFHTALKPLSTLRKELGFRTIFNLIGPLANPAGTKRQLIGVFDKDWVRPVAEALYRLGSTAAMVVHGADGLDEITLTRETYCAELKDGMITEYTLTPDDFGLPSITAQSIKGGDAVTNATALMALLEGEKSGYRDIVLANAAAALKLSGKATDLKTGCRIAAEAIDSRRALSVLEHYRDFSKEN